MLDQVRRKATTVSAGGATLVRLYQLAHVVFLFPCCDGDKMTCAILSVNNYFAKNYVAVIPRLCYVFPINRGNVQMTNVKQMNREDLQKIGNAEALNEILARNARLATAKQIMRELKEKARE
jgi:hypothetical protein